MTLTGTSFGREYYTDRVEINGNWYLVLVYPQNDAVREKYTAIVYAHDDGRKMDELHPGEIVSERGLRERARFQTRRLDKSFDRHISDTLNKAVCQLEDKQEREQDYADRIASVLEANKEVHEDLDYLL